MITDLGERCDRHSGETYLPRCYECAALQVSTSVDLPPGTKVPPVDNSGIRDSDQLVADDLVANALASWGLVKR